MAHLLVQLMVRVVIRGPPNELNLTPIRRERPVFFPALVQLVQCETECLGALAFSRSLGPRTAIR